ncbi:hypothetical protein T01_11338 [Trichinella spiralis]|uniref:Uncharacterized protein n=1 Tax=Trichinella spiralis TaxID=6334 RepID=A0A0V1AU82_TRISP|nr:hypothetical protein T01_11338 [Trichinella spiralis]
MLFDKRWRCVTKVQVQNATFSAPVKSTLLANRSIGSDIRRLLSNRLDLTGEHDYIFNLHLFMAFNFILN